MPDYSTIDQPSILMFVFYPRKDFTPCPENAFDLLAPVGDRVSILTAVFTQAMSDGHGSYSSTVMAKW